MTCYVDQGFTITFDSKYTDDAKSDLEKRLGLFTDPAYACSQLSGRFIL